MESTKVIIRSIPRQTATKVSEFTDRKTGKKLNKNKIGKCTDAYRAQYSEKTGKLLTGLTEVVNNPFYKSEKNVPHEFEYVKTKEKITLQELLEIKHNKPRGFYTDRAWQPGDGYNEANLTFFQKFKFKLNDGSTILDLSKPLEEVAYYMLKAHPLVAGSNKIEDKILKPKAEYYVSDKNESIQEKYTKRRQYNDCITKLEDNKFTPSYQRKVAKVLQLFKGDLSSVTDESIYISIDNFIEEGYKSKPENLTAFEEAYKLTSSAEGRKELEATCLLEDLVSYRIVTDNKGTYVWVSKQLVLGQRKVEAIDFLLDPKKQPEKDEMERQLKAKLVR
jgi:hypothetical protein